ncbi:unnamed protein product [Blumeria hordei]|uniref:Uncharacterized protein n=2 Tax=Blumeria hordei TaxID=2867405 RepID=A0A383UG89_BLUHO|nr:CSEP0077 putative effector protein [Blumeria hordei DH14]SZE99289.1 unnamed protein product [Blumeria hordei]
MKITLLPFIIVFSSIWAPAFASYYDCNGSHISISKVHQAIHNYGNFQQNHGYLLNSFRLQHTNTATIDHIDPRHQAYTFLVDFDQGGGIKRVYSALGREIDECKYMY